MTALLSFAERGPHAVGVRTLELADPHNPGRTLATDVWYPAAAGSAGQTAEAEHPFGRPHAAHPDALPSTERFPLVGFSHGNSGLRRQSTFLTTHLASWGFVVVAPDHSGNTFFEMLELDEDARRKVHFDARRNRPLDLQTALAAVEAGGSALPAVDAERIGVAGHSYGGWTAFKLPAQDARVRAVLGLAPASEPFVGRKAFAPGELPLPSGVASLVVAAQEDVLVDLATSVQPLFERLAAPTRLLAIERADHYHFCDGVALLHGAHAQNPRPNQPRPTKPAAELLPEPRMHRAVRAVATAFFAGALSGDDDPLRSLTQASVAELDRAVRVLG